MINIKMTELSTTSFITQNMEGGLGSAMCDCMTLWSVNFTVMI